MTEALGLGLGLREGVRELLGLGLALGLAEALRLPALLLVGWALEGEGEGVRLPEAVVLLLWQGEALREGVRVKLLLLLLPPPPLLPVEESV